MTLLLDIISVNIAKYKSDIRGSFHTGNANINTQKAAVFAELKIISV